MNRLEELTARIDAREARIGVIGLGYVGLPLGARVREGGLPRDRLRPRRREGRGARARARSYIEDVPSAEVAEARRARASFTATTDFGELSALRRDQRLRADAAHQDQGPRRLVHGRARWRTSASACAPASWSILGSTTYPGHHPRAVRADARGDGPRARRATSRWPSRPSASTRPTSSSRVREVPKVVGGETPLCTELAAQVFERDLRPAWCRSPRRRAPRW